MRSPARKQIEVRVPIGGPYLYWVLRFQGRNDDYYFFGRRRVTPGTGAVTRIVFTRVR